MTHGHENVTHEQTYFVYINVRHVNELHDSANRHNMFPHVYTSEIESVQN